jgi:hypothetical protein
LRAIPALDRAVNDLGSSGVDHLDDLIGLVARGWTWAGRRRHA